MQIVEFIFSSGWVFLGTLILFFTASFSWALTFYWLTRYKESMQDKILKELEIARLERYEYDKLISQLIIQDPFKQ
tara:strand:+ start:21579 stop:21806 length:228 start_codon:yes stop_codon:yes gene_type:complete